MAIDEKDIQSKYHTGTTVRQTIEFGKIRAYNQPRLTHYGQLSNLTLGGSPGSGDSGNGTMEKLFGT